MPRTKPRRTGIYLRCHGGWCRMDMLSTFTAAAHFTIIADMGEVWVGFRTFRSMRQVPLTV